MGRTYKGVERSSFIIGPDGRIEHVLERVKPMEHVDLVLEALAQPMIWTLIAIVLVAWFIGLLLQIGPLVNLLLVAAAVLLVVQLINERESRPTEFRHASCSVSEQEVASMLWTLLVILLVLWLLGLIGELRPAAFIHLLLVIAAIVLIYNLLAGRSTV